MTSKADWQEAYRQLVAAGRKRVAEPPTAEEVQALFAGDLPEPEAERVRELLAYYPEMARAMVDPFPMDAAGVLSDAELANHREQLRRKVGLPAPEPQRPVPIAEYRKRRAPLRLAAVAAVVLLLGAGSYAVWLATALPSETRVLHADGQRGEPPNRGISEQVPIQLFTETRYHFKVVYRPERAYTQYRIELVDLTAAQTIWTREGLQRDADGSFPVSLSTRGLAPGRYRLVLSGVAEKSDELAIYTIRLSERPQGK